MRFGFICPSYIWNLFRHRLAEASLASLGRSITEGLEAPPVIIFVGKPEVETMDVLRRYQFPQFVTDIIAEPSTPPASTPVSSTASSACTIPART